MMTTKEEKNCGHRDAFLSWQSCLPGIEGQTNKWS